MSSSSTIQTLFSNAKDAVKNILGFEQLSLFQDDIFPQRLYLNDISTKKWKALRPTTPIIKYNPVVGFPSNYSWPTKNQKFRTNSVRYPFLQQIQLHQIPTLRPTHTVDKSVYIADKTFKMRPSSFSRTRVLSDIRSFNQSTLKSIPSTKPGLLSQAKDMMNSALGGMKEALGMNIYPQAQTHHEQPFLNDIASGNWKSLKNVTTTVKYFPVVGLPSGYSWSNSRRVRTNFVRYPFLKQIREGTKLRASKINDRSMYIPDKSFKLRSFGRNKLLSDIRSFNQSSLKSTKPGLLSQAKDVMNNALGGMKEVLGMNIYPQAQTQHEQPFLNDIVKGNWKSLNKVSTNVKYTPVVGLPSGYSWSNSRRVRTNFIRYPFLQQIREGTKLRQVQQLSGDKGQQWREGTKGWRMSKPSNRQQLLLSIREFDTSGLKRIEGSLIETKGKEWMSKAKGFVTEQVDSVKEAFGMNSYPQRENQHLAPYLDDIAKGSYETLNHVETRDKVEERKELLNDIRENRELHHIGSS